MNVFYTLYLMCYFRDFVHSFFWLFEQDIMSFSGVYFSIQDFLVIDCDAGITCLMNISLSVIFFLCANLIFFLRVYNFGHFVLKSV